jgi:hypothetical protein
MDFMASINLLLLTFVKDPKLNAQNIEYLFHSQNISSKNS